MRGDIQTETEALFWALSVRRTEGAAQAEKLSAMATLIQLALQAVSPAIRTRATADISTRDGLSVVTEPGGERCIVPIPTLRTGDATS